MSRRHNGRVWLWGILTVAVTAFILFNGSRTGEESMTMSGWVMAVLSPMLNLLSRVFGEADWSFWIRKAAHATEYAALGFCAAFAAHHMARKVGRPLVVHAVLYALVTAVTDEFIQGFVERTSSVSDVVIDLGGALCGVAIATAIGRWCRSLKRKGGTV